MKRLNLFILLFTMSCSSTPDNIKESIFLLEESVTAVDNATKIIYYQIKENAFKYQEKALPWLLKADQIDSIIINYYTYLDETKDSKLGVSRSEYSEGYLEVIEDINQILKSESFEPPEWFELPTADSIISLDSLDRKIIPSVIKLQLSLIKADAFHRLRLRAPSGVSDHFGKTIYIVNEEINGNKVQFDLSSHIFGIEEDRYIKIDSVLKNGKKVNVSVDKMQQFTFQRLSLDSLMPGTYQVFGTGIIFRNGNDQVESFSHDFEIRARR